MLVHDISAGVLRFQHGSHLELAAPAGLVFGVRSGRLIEDGHTVASAGGSPRHIPVLASQALHWLAPRSGGTYVDATFGDGGYTRAILKTANTKVIGIDRDRAAIAAGLALLDAAGGRLT